MTLVSRLLLAILALCHSLLAIHFVIRPIVMGWERMRNMTTSEQEG